MSDDGSEQQVSGTRNSKPETRNPIRTVAGTPCARSWSDDWIAEVEAAESRTGRRICGARTMAGTPCLLESNHTSGRCRFHGGFDLTGAPKGNRNAVLHGLYSRRLQVCGPHCARWSTCPLAGSDVVAAASGRIQNPEDRSRDAGNGQSDRSDPTDRSDGCDATSRPAGEHQTGPRKAAQSRSLANNEQRTTNHDSGPSDPPPKEPAGSSKAFEERTDSCLLTSDSSPSSSRFLPADYRLQPTDSPSPAALYSCPYEQAEYNTVLTDALALTEANGTAFDAHTAHTAALLQVMVSRAAAAMAQVSLHEATTVEAGDYRQESTKLHVFLQAFLRLQREHDRVRKSLEALRGDTARMVTVEPTKGPEGGCRTSAELGESLLEQEPSVEPVKRHAQRAAHDVDLDPDAQAAIHFEDAIATQHAERELARAVLYGTEGRDIPMLDAVERAWLLDPELVEQREQAVLSAYRPGKEVLPEKAVRRIVRAMTRKRA